MLQKDRGNQKTRDLLFPFLLLLAAWIAAGINFNFGFSNDLDGHFLVNQALKFQTSGLLPSRSWGFPGYEMVVYPIISYLGLTYAKALSLIYYSLACLVMYWIFVNELRLSKSTAFLGSLAFVLLPISIVGGNTILETSQGVLLALVSIFFYFRYLRGGNFRDLALIAIFTGLSVSTRPDYLFFGGAVGLAVLIFRRPPIKQVVAASGIAVLFGFGPFLFYRSLNFNLGVVLPDPLPMKIARAALGVVILFGVPAWAFIVTALYQKRKQWTTRLKNDLQFRWTLVLLMFSAAFYAVRYILLPDEIEYIYILAVLVILLVAQLHLREWSLAVFMLLVFIPNVLQIYLFVNDATGKLTLSPGISPGVIVQDRSARLKLDFLDQSFPNLANDLARKLGYSSYSLLPSIQEKDLVIIPMDQLRFYTPTRFDGKYYQAACTQRIFLYPMPSNRGWRQSIRFEEWRPVTLDQLQEYKFAQCK